MNQVEPAVFIEWVHQHTESQPPAEARDIQELWKDVDKHEIREQLADLWQWGIIDARLNEDGEQMVSVTEFGEELETLGVTDQYVKARLGEPVELPGFNPNQTAVRTL